MRETPQQTNSTDKLSKYWLRRIKESLTIHNSILYKYETVEGNLLLSVSNDLKRTIQREVKNFTRMLVNFYIPKLNKEFANDIKKLQNSTQCAKIAMYVIENMKKIPIRELYIESEIISTQYRPATHPTQAHNTHSINLFTVWNMKDEEALFSVAIDFTAGYTLDMNKGNYRILAIACADKSKILEKLQLLSNSTWK